MLKKDIQGTCQKHKQNSIFALASHKYKFLGVACFVVCLSTNNAAWSDTLRDAMIASYHKNFSLQAQRLRARASDEGVSRALSGYRPKVSGFANYRVSSEGSDNNNLNFDDSSFGYGARLDQPLFDGFKTYNAVKEAEASAEASHHDLIALENDILFETARSYLGVLHDEGVLLLRKRNLTSLRRELIGVRDRYDRGQGTVTDIEQVKIRLASARSQLKAAEAALQASHLRYTRVTHRRVSGFRMPDFPEGLLPKTLSQAIDLGSQYNPVIASAAKKSEAAEHAIKRHKADLLPNANLSAGYSSEDDVSFSDVISNEGSDDNFFVRAQVNIPLYQGGEVSARVRESVNIAGSLDREKRHVEVKMAEDIGAIWAELKAARERRVSDEEAVISSERALDGVRSELKVGQRTVMDVLDADRELVNSRIKLLATERDLHLAAYALVRSIGQLTISRIDPSVKRYDAKAYHEKARGKLWGTETPETGHEEFLKDDGQADTNLQNDELSSYNQETGATGKNLSYVVDPETLDQDGLTNWKKMGTSEGWKNSLQVGD